MSNAAKELFDQHQYAEAAAAYREMLTTDPANAVSWKNLGLSLALIGEHSEGIEACQRAYDLQPGSAEIRYGLGYAYGAAKQYEKAMSELDAALYLDPMNVGAKQSLLYCLVQHGTDLAASDDPRLAEPFLDRAHKIAPQSPNTIVPLLKLFIETKQPMKVVKIVQGIPANLKSDPTIEPLLEVIQNDPEFSTHLKVSSAAETPSLQVPNSTGTVAPPAAQQAVVYVGCPNCKLQISAMAFICPHCNFRIKDSGTFAGRDTGPAYAWQDVALTIISVIMLIIIAIDVFRALRVGGMMVPYVLTMDALQLVIALGCLLRWDMVMTVAKYLMYLPLLMSAFGVMASFMMGIWLGALFLLLQACIIGFFIYLLNWASD